jgi:HD superfamily phosphohydrolase YqeK
LFTENYTLQFDVDLPQKHLFQDTDNINNASGCIYLADISEKHKGYEYVIILLSNADYSKALYLILQKISVETSEAEHIIIKNFIENKE